MSAFEQHLAEDRRLVILRLLKEAPGNSLNDRLVAIGLKAVGHTVSVTTVRSDFVWLKQAQAVDVQCEIADVHVASLTQLGADHVERTAIIPGIKRPAIGG